MELVLLIIAGAALLANILLVYLVAVKAAKINAQQQLAAQLQDAKRQLEAQNNEQAEKIAALQQLQAEQQRSIAELQTQVSAKFEAAGQLNVAQANQLKEAVAEGFRKLEATIREPLL